MRFLVATDGSHASTKALDHAVELAGETGGSITVAYAVDPQAYAEGGEVPPTDVTEYDDRLLVEDEDDVHDRGRQIVDAAAERARAAGVEADTALLDGDPSEALPDYAASGEYDGVFVGHRGLDPHEERLLGSVAKTLVERSPVPVTVVR
jgi:nucleotide-binding universal stress UspA family protein